MPRNVTFPFPVGTIGDHVTPSSVLLLVQGYAWPQPPSTDLCAVINHRAHPVNTLTSCTREGRGRERGSIDSRVPPRENTHGVLRETPQCSRPDSRLRRGISTPEKEGTVRTAVDESRGKDRQRPQHLPLRRKSLARGTAGGMAAEAKAFVCNDVIRRAHVSRNTEQQATALRGHTAGLLRPPLTKGGRSNPSVSSSMFSLGRVRSATELSDWPRCAAM